MIKQEEKNDPGDNTVNPIRTDRKRLTRDFHNNNEHKSRTDEEVEEQGSMSNSDTDDNDEENPEVKRYWEVKLKEGISKVCDIVFVCWILCFFCWIIVISIINCSLCLLISLLQPQKKSHLTRDVRLVFMKKGVCTIQNKERAGEYCELCL